MNDTSQVYDTVVIGGGPAGLTAAIALAETGARTALLARRAPYADNRTTALLGASTELLERLDVWRRCSAKAAALQTMRLVDDTGRLIRAPEVRFSSEEIGLDQSAGRHRLDPDKTRSIIVRTACRRCRRAAVAFARSGRHRRQAPRPASIGVDLQHRAFAPAQKYLDRVSYAAGSLRVRAAARQSL
jgi:glycine/D-amino acid oxidase-like deaminating enzyme